MAANANDGRVGPRGQFIGAAGKRFRDQTQADLYFRDQRMANAPNTWEHRIQVGCVGWGLSIVGVQRRQLPGPVAVNAETRPAIRQRLDATQPQPNPAGRYLLNGQLRRGHVIPWDRRVWVRRSDQGDIHYHQAYARQNHGPSIPDIDTNWAEASYKVGACLDYGSQVQNYRRLLP